MQKFVEHILQIIDLAIGALVAKLILVIFIAVMNWSIWIPQIIQKDSWVPM